MAASLAGEEAEEEARLVARVRTMLALLRCCVHTLSPHSRRWGPLTPHLPGILAQVSALVSLLLLPSLRCSLESKVGVSRSGGGGGGNAHSRHRSVRTGASHERLGGEERGNEEREEEGAVAPEVLSAMAVRWEVSVSAARIIALARKPQKSLVPYERARNMAKGSEFRVLFFSFFRRCGGVRRWRWIEEVLSVRCRYLSSLASLMHECMPRQ